MGTKAGKKSSSKSSAPPQSTGQDYALPADFGVEKSILGAILLNNDTYYEAAAADVEAGDFHLDSHRVLWAAIDDLLGDRIPVDLITLNHYLDGVGDLARIGGIEYVSGLVDGVPDRPSIKHYVDILKDLSMRRAAVYLSNRLIAAAIDKSDPIKLTLSMAHEDMLRIQGNAQQQKIFQVKDFVGEVLADIRAKMDFNPNVTVGLPFGLEELDESTTGMRPGQFVVVAGTPKSGKTSFAIDTARKLAKAGVAVGIFSREMLKEELMERILAQESDVVYTKIRKPSNLPLSEFRLLERTKAEIEKWPLYIDDTATTIGEIIPRAHLMINKEKVKLLVVDYLQIIGGPGERAPERVANVTDQLTLLAKTTKTPVLALSQLTIPSTEKKNPWNILPTMAMLRESGQIAQNAHIILFTYHPRNEDTNEPTGEDLVIIGEQRAGPVGRCKAWFNVALQRWEERGIAATTPKDKQSELPMATA